MTIILINFDTRHSVPAVMRVISVVKAITLAAEAVRSNKTRIAAAVAEDVIKSVIAILIDRQYTDHIISKDNKGAK